MLYLEPLVDQVLNTEGQILLGLDYITDTLGLSMKKMEGIFKATILQYGRRRPIEITQDFFSGPDIQMPEGTLGIKSIRWGILPEYPRHFQDAWSETTYEYNMQTKILKVFPPNTQVKVTYVAYPTLTKSKQIRESFHAVQGETVYQDILQSTYRQGTLSINQNNLVMTEISRNTVTGVVTLGGTLGTGTLNLSTREFEINLSSTFGGEISVTYYPQYYCCVELDIGDYIFYKFFALNILRSLASLKAQYTQDKLHNIDLTTEDLMGRVRDLEREVRELLKKTVSFGGMAQI